MNKYANKFSMYVCLSMFHIVDLTSAEKKETEVVPSSWVQDGLSYWPPYSSTERCTRAVKRQEAPDETWGLFDVNIRYTRSELNLDFQSTTYK